MTKKIDEPTPRKAYGVPQFCDAHDISRGKFYNMLQDGTGPRIMKVGTRTLISEEAAAEWRQRMTDLTNSVE